MDWAGILIFVGMMLLLLYGMWISMDDNLDKNTHHDNRQGSHYYESNKAKGNHE